jgi:RHS repeat-associated protein
VPIISGVQWEPFGGVKGWLWNLLNGTTASLQAHERTRDTYGRLVRYRLGATIRDITYDEAGRITKYTHYDATTGAAVPGQDQTFSYDELDRLVSVSAGGSSWALAYDANGNRTSVVLNGTSSSYTTAASSNQLTATTNPTRGFTLDAAGNTLARSTTNPYTAAYSLENRLSTMTVGTAITSYSYDAMGQRTRKHTGTAASTTIFAYDDQGQLLGEYSNTGAALREFIWFNNEPIAVFTPAATTPATNPPQVLHIHSDHLGTPRVILNKANQSRWSWMAEPFGTTAANTNPQGLGNFTFNLRMPGQYADSETGLFYNYFRDLDTAMGRYVQSDPIGLEGGINTYAYVNANPSMYVDPNGLWLKFPQPWQDASDGFVSYFGGLRNAGVHMFQRSGLAGECLQRRATENEAALATALYSLSDPNVARRAAIGAQAWASSHQAYLFGRLSAGGIASGVTGVGLYGGLSLGSIAGMGDAL